MSQAEKRKVKISPNLAQAFWRANISLAVKLLFVWFLVSFGAGIIFRDWLNQFSIGSAPLGFWFAQQGSIYIFVLIIFIYVRMMGNIERQFGLSDEPFNYGETPVEQKLSQYRKKPTGNRMTESTLDPIPKYDPSNPRDPQGFVKVSEEKAIEPEIDDSENKEANKTKKNDVLGANKDDDVWGA